MEYNIVVPHRCRSEIEDLKSETFQILGMANITTRGEYFFHIETTEEEKISFLALKYGERLVWKS